MAGSTIEQAQAVMSYREFLGWVAYRNKRGPLHSSRRLDIAIGRLMALMATQGGAKDVNPYDFMPYETEPPISIEEAMKQWQ